MRPHRASRRAACLTASVCVTAIRTGSPRSISSTMRTLPEDSAGRTSILSKEFFANQTPAGAALLAHKQAFLKSVAPAIDQSDPLIGDIDQLGRAKMYLLERDIDRKIGECLKEGKDPLDLFDRLKPDYIGKPESLERYRTTAREALEENARELGSKGLSGADAASQSVPPRLNGETPAEYLARMNAALPDANVRVPLSR